MIRLYILNIPRFAFHLARFRFRAAAAGLTAPRRVAALLCREKAKIRRSLLVKRAKFGAENPEAGRVESLCGRPLVIETRINPVRDFIGHRILPCFLTRMKFCR